jgi:hypothetical protein
MFDLSCLHLPLSVILIVVSAWLGDHMRTPYAVGSNISCGLDLDDLEILNEPQQFSHCFDQSQFVFIMFHIQNLCKYFSTTSILKEAGCSSETSLIFTILIQNDIKKAVQSVTPPPTKDKECCPLYKRKVNS